MKGPVGFIGFVGMIVIDPHTPWYLREEKMTL